MGVFSISDCIVKILPADPFCRVPAGALRDAKTFLETHLRCDFVEMEANDTPVFVDCGANLERISCPLCGAEIDFAWWGEVMDSASENAFAVLEAEMPCCQKKVSLNDLNYDFPCGFACCFVSIFNPEQDVDDKLIGAVRDIWGVNVRVVKAHL